MSLEGETAIVTGGSRGIGLAIVKALLNKKVSVATIDLQFTERIGECKKIAKDMEVQFLNWEGDISLRLNVEKFVDAVIAKIGRPSILVNNAGIASPGELMRLKEEQWDNVMKINVKGSFILTQVVASHMIKLNGGTIINIASMSGLEPLSGSGAYSISKAALIMLSKQLALELAKYGIRVNAVSLG
jgi:3-oxoacyl-[acyl-carrier protein] reductase